MTLNPIDEQNKTIRCLQDQIETLEAKVQRLQDSRLAKYASMAMSGLLANHEIFWDYHQKSEISEMAVKQAKALIAALDEEKGNE